MSARPEPFLKDGMRTDDTFMLIASQWLRADATNFADSEAACRFVSKSNPLLRIRFFD